MSTNGANGWRPVVISALITAVIVGAGWVTTLAVAASERPTRREMTDNINSRLAPLAHDVAELEAQVKDFNATIAEIDKSLAVLRSQNDRIIEQLERDS